MPFNSALTSPDYVRLRGSYEGEQYLSLCPNTIIFAARVNQASFAASFAQVTYDTVTVGAFGDIEVGQTVYLSRTNSIRAAYFRGRVRAAPTSSILNINETSVDVDDNDYIFVVNDFDVHEKLARPSGSTQLKDYNLTFTRLKPIVYNLQSAYVLWAGDTLEQRFNPSALAPTQGDSIASYAFTIASGMTVTGGDENTNDVTIAFDVGFYWLELVVATALGLSLTRRIPVWAVPANFASQVELGFTGAQITGDLELGYNASVSAFEGVRDVLDGTLAVVWGIERHNGTAGALLSNVQFVGRFRRESDTTQADDTYSQLQETGFELEGPGAQLARTTAPLLALVYKASATVWDEIVNITHWRAICHLLSEHSTYLSLHSLSFDDTGNGFTAQGFVTQGDNLLSAVNDIAFSVNAAVEFAPSGEARIGRNAAYLSETARDALTTIANLASYDWLNLSLSVDHAELVGKVEASGGTFNTISGKATPLLAVAPGVAQGAGQDKTDLHRQILAANVNQATAQSELNTRAANRYAEANGRTELTVDLPDGYHALIPSRLVWYTWTIEASDNTRGRAFTAEHRWQLTQTEVDHDNEAGTKAVSATFRLETGAGLSAIAGQTVAYPAISETAPALPPLPPINPFPSFPDPPDIYLPPAGSDGDLPPVLPTPPDAIPTDGNAVLLGTEAAAWVTRNFIPTLTPTYREITPTLNGSLVHGQWQGTGVYLLETNGENSWVHYASDGFANPPAWVLSGTLPGAYSILKPASTPGQVYIYKAGISDDAWCYEFDFTNDDGGWSPILFGTYSPGVGWEDTNVGPGSSINITRLFGDAHLTYFEVDTTSSIAGGSNHFLGFLLNGVPQGGNAFGGQLVGGLYTYSVSLDVDADEIIYNPSAQFDADTILVTRILICGTGFDPFAGSTGGDAARTRYSNDYGATFEAEQVVGSTPGAFGGLDTIKIGTLALAAAAAQVMRGTLPGGAWTPYGTLTPGSLPPSAIWIPRRTFAGGDNSSTGTPVFLVHSGTLAGGSLALFKVTSSGNTFTDITPNVGAAYGKAVSPHSIAMPWQSGSRMAVVAEYGSARHLHTSLSAGVVWADRGTLTNQASYVRYHKGSLGLQQLYLADGAPVYSPDHGGTLIKKAHPDAVGTLNPILFIEPYYP